SQAVTPKSMVKEKVVRVSFAVNAPLRQAGVLRDVSIAIGERAGADQFRLPRRLVGVLTVQVHVLPFTHPKHRCHLPSHKSRAAVNRPRSPARLAGRGQAPGFSRGVVDTFLTQIPVAPAGPAGSPSSPEAPAPRTPPPSPG